MYYIKLLKSNYKLLLFKFNYMKISSNPNTSCISPNQYMNYTTYECIDKVWDEKITKLTKDKDNKDTIEKLISHKFTSLVLQLKGRSSSINERHHWLTQYPACSNVGTFSFVSKCLHTVISKGTISILLSKRR
jgi:hypothetical protein